MVPSPGAVDSTRCDQVPVCPNLFGEERSDATRSFIKREITSGRSGTSTMVGRNMSLPCDSAADNRSTAAVTSATASRTCSRTSTSNHCFNARSGIELTSTSSTSASAAPTESGSGSPNGQPSRPPRPRLLRAAILPPRAHPEYDRAVCG